jgi:hypothetical protein
VPRGFGRLFECAGLARVVEMVTDGRARGAGDQFRAVTALEPARITDQFARVGEVRNTIRHVNEDMTSGTCRRSRTSSGISRPRASSSRPSASTTRLAATGLGRTLNGWIAQLNMFSPLSGRPLSSETSNIFGFDLSLEWWK